MESWLERSLKVIPGGSQTYSKSYKYFTRPFFACQGLGGILVSDEDCGDVSQVREYHDFSMALGSVILGYKTKQWLLDLDVPNGINFSCPHPLEVILAEKLVEIIPSAEMVKFFKNGSDATEIAVRLARAYTGRDIILAGSYHGFHDWYVYSIDRNKGIPYQGNEVGTAEHIYQFNNYSNLKELFEAFYIRKRFSDESNVAGVIVEPDHGDIREISELAVEHGAVLIFDEVMTGFRYHIGGLQTLFGITPDITCLGKCMANGLPLSAVVGRRDIMKLMEEGVFASSTFGGETLSLVAALKTIEELEKNGKWLWHVGGKWASQMDILIRKKGLTQIVKVIGLAPRSGVKFFDEGNVSAIEYQSLYQQELLKRRILTHGLNNFCLDHTDEQIDYFIKMADEVLDIIGEAYKDNNAQKYLDNGIIQTMFRR